MSEAHLAKWVGDVWVGHVSIVACLNCTIGSQGACKMQYPESLLDTHTEHATQTPTGRKLSDVATFTFHRPFLGRFTALSGEAAAAATGSCSPARVPPGIREANT